MDEPLLASPASSWACAPQHWSARPHRFFQGNFEPSNMFLWLTATMCAALIAAAASLLWQEVPVPVQTSVALFVGAYLLGFVLISLYIAKWGLVSFLPQSIQTALLDMSLVDIFQRFWLNGDVVDAVALLWLRLSSDETEDAVSRLPSGVRDLLTRPGIAFLAPSLVRDVLLPRTLRDGHRAAVRPLISSTCSISHLRFDDEASTRSLPSQLQLLRDWNDNPYRIASLSQVLRHERVPSDCLEPVQSLPALFGDVVDKRIRKMMHAVIRASLSRTPLRRWSPNDLRVAVGCSGAVLLMHLARSRRMRRVAGGMIEAGSFGIVSLFLLATSLQLGYKLRSDKRQQLCELAEASVAEEEEKQARSKTYWNNVLKVLAFGGAAAGTYAVFRRRLTKH